MISHETIDDVKNRIDIIDVIGDFVTLKRSGQNYKALSPFTNEKTASFYVVPSKGIFKDFSSGKGGDAISFIMEHEGLGYTEAIRYLAKKYGVDIKEEQQAVADQVNQSQRDGLYIIMNYAKDYYSDLLFHDEEGKSIGLSYFRERGFNDRTIQKFELGYSRNEWDHLSKAAIVKGYSREMLEKSGLVVVKDEGRSYDRFRGRVIFPVHNLSGKVIAFGARILTKEKDQPKYINSPETEIYHKSQVLYGMFQAKNAIRKEDFCYLVEGYTDVISLHQADVENAVASSGTALTEEQIKLMRRFTENVTVLFDGDAAGIKAALRGIDLVLKGGLNVRIVLLPDSEDPDSYSRKLGSTAFKEYLKQNTKDFISFKIDLLKEDVGNDPIKRANLIQEIVDTISVIPDPLKRTVYLQECSKKLEVNLQILITEVNKKLITAKHEKRSATQTQQSKNRNQILDSQVLGDIQLPPETLNPLYLDDLHSMSKSFLLSPEEILKLFEKEYIKVLINRGYKKIEEEAKNGFDFEFQYLFEEAEAVDFVEPMNQEITEAYKGEIAKGNIVSPETFIKILSDANNKYIAELLVQKYFVSTGWEKHHIIIDDEYTIQSLKKVTLQWKLGFIQKMMRDNLLKIKKAVEQQELDGLLEIQLNIDRYKNQYAGELGIVILPTTKLIEI